MVNKLSGDPGFVLKFQELQAQPALKFLLAGARVSINTTHSTRLRISLTNLKWAVPHHVTYSVWACVLVSRNTSNPSHKIRSQSEIPLNWSEWQAVRLWCSVPACHWPLSVASAWMPSLSRACLTESQAINHQHQISRLGLVPEMCVSQPSEGCLG